MSAGFSFDDTQGFDENFEAFLCAAEAIDKSFAAILRNNAKTLKQIVQEGERDTASRSSFNTMVAAALDQLVSPPDQGEGE